VLPLMRVGDRWTLTIPSQLAFGPKGRPSSAGKPRIPADTTVIFEVEMVGLPGKEPELIELIGDV
jgi:FKBP-type peptidyl-prolyl cis-trans isomerase